MSPFESGRQAAVSTRSQIAALQRRLGVTTLYVTHDQVEAMTMGDRVAVIKDGILQQVDVPRVLYDSPVNAFVAGFIGSPAMNLLGGVIVDHGVQIGRSTVSLPRSFHQAVGAGPVIVGLRPEALELSGDGTGLPAVVKLVEELGAEAFIYAQLDEPAGEALNATPDLVVRVDPSVVVKAGDRITLRVKDDSMLLFDAESGARITGSSAVSVTPSIAPPTVERRSGDSVSRESSKWRPGEPGSRCSTRGAVARTPAELGAARGADDPEVR